MAADAPGPDSKRTVRDDIAELRKGAGLTQTSLARLLGTSLVSVDRWERGAATPSTGQRQRIADALAAIRKGENLPADLSRNGVFASRGIRTAGRTPPLFRNPITPLALMSRPRAQLLRDLQFEGVFDQRGKRAIDEIIGAHAVPAPSPKHPQEGPISAGKNSYTYDAHTYHTKVPPQGIAELIQLYLPEGGLVLDPFAGSGMTGVAASATGHDCILNELSPAAAFIASQFVARQDPDAFRAAVDRVFAELAHERQRLYTTQCRECGRETEILYTVWSFRVRCSGCNGEFQLWDVCRRFGRTVREHKILGEFNCPACDRPLKKSRLQRTVAEPVELGYICCGSRQKEAAHPLTDHDRALIYELDRDRPAGGPFVPTSALPDGVNLSQPKRHGLDTIDKFYTSRNLRAMSALWESIHRIGDVRLSAQLAFVFTSLYQRVTKLSEFRFWGGSGNTARFNVPFIFNEANVFVTFARKAASIEDHLRSTAAQYSGKTVVTQGSASRLTSIPDESIDLIFTDPPFGANINYSEMNFLWESWLGTYTDATEEAIISRAQSKGVAEYRELMTASLRECYRVLRPERWMLLVFMNAAGRVWDSVRLAIGAAGFQIMRADAFDKQHGTFKQFVSANTAGEDLVLHCMKTRGRARARPSPTTTAESVARFVAAAKPETFRTAYLHVDRPADTDWRKLYSDWLSVAVVEGVAALDMSEFIATVRSRVPGLIDEKA